MNAISNGPIYEIRLTPIEPILFRDHRTARAGQDHDLKAQEPSPHTIFGAIGANIAAQYGVPIDEDEYTWMPLSSVLGGFCNVIDQGSKKRAELLGYMYCDIENQPWYPWPRHIQFINRYGTIRVGELPRFRECKNDLVSCTERNMEFLLENNLHENEEEPTGYISEAVLADILMWSFKENQLLMPENAQKGINYLPTDQLHQPEMRAGLRMQYSSNTAETEMLFTRPYRRFFSGVTNEYRWGSAGFLAFYRTIGEIKGKLKAPVAFLGGDRGRAIISYKKITPASPLQTLKAKIKKAAAGSRGFFAYLLTPAVREERWPEVDGHKPVAAAIGREQVFSGWNINRSGQHPREIRHLIPAGSVFFYAWNTDEKKELLIESKWLEPLSDSFRNSGFGRILLGVWK
ncbi:MAG: hypothetical protein JRH18_11585 [Deltaproteobacteria bacterium]|nr:hypothetical protein [Deltaproteobacteria bacterium]MBW2152299.1 hypothetical protein [Deltaproteobacteria bacterium]